MILGKRTLRFGNRVREDTVLIARRRFERDGVEYHRDDVVPKDVSDLKRLWNLEKVHLRFFTEDDAPSHEGPWLQPQIQVEEDPFDPDVDTVDADADHVIKEDPALPEPHKSGKGWWRIDGVEQAFRTAAEAQAAWDLEHGG